MVRVRVVLCVTIAKMFVHTEEGTDSKLRLIESPRIEGVQAFDPHFRPTDLL